MHNDNPRHLFIIKSRETQAQTYDFLYHMILLKNVLNIIYNQNHS